MATVLDLLRKVQSFNVIEAAGKAMEENKKPLLDINRAQLYDEGIGYDGQPLPPYSANYAKRKPSRGIVDIYKTGLLQKEMELFVDNDKYIITSYAEYTPYVHNRRPTIFGFTEDGKREAWFIIRPSFIGEFKAHTGLK